MSVPFLLHDRACPITGVWCTISPPKVKQWKKAGVLPRLSTLNLATFIEEVLVGHPSPRLWDGGRQDRTSFRRSSRGPVDSNWWRTGVTPYVPEKTGKRTVGQGVVCVRVQRSGVDEGEGSTQVLRPFCLVKFKRLGLSVTLRRVGNVS